MEKTKRKNDPDSPPESRIPWFEVIALILILVIAAIVILGLFGPTVGNVYSNICRGCFPRG